MRFTQCNINNLFIFGFFSDYMVKRVGRIRIKHNWKLLLLIIFLMIIFISLSVLSGKTILSCFLAKDFRISSKLAPKTNSLPRNDLVNLYGKNFNILINNLKKKNSILLFVDFFIHSPAYILEQI